MGRKDAELFRKEEGGSYKYIGDYYRFRLNGTDISRRKRVFLYLAAALTAAFVITGMADSDITRFFASALPYVSCALPLGYLIAASFFTLRHPENMTFVQYKSGPRRLVRSAKALTVTSAVTLLGGIVRVLMKGLAPSDAQFLVGAAVMCLLSAAVVVLYSACPAEKTV